MLVNYSNSNVFSDGGSSVAKGGGGLEPPPIGLKSMQNCTFLELLKPIFAQKMKTAPPKGFWCQSWEGVAVIRPEEPFELPISPEKSLSLSVKTFFFLEITCIWAEKAFEFPISAEKYVSILDKPFESDSRAMKIRVKVAYSCLTLSKKSPPLFSKSWLRAWTGVCGRSAQPPETLGPWAIFCNFLYKIAILMPFANKFCKKNNYFNAIRMSLEPFKKTRLFTFENQLKKISILLLLTF